MRPGKFKGDLPGSSATWSESPDLSEHTQSPSASLGIMTLALIVSTHRILAAQ